jgi:hypothetical protein
MYPGVKKPDLKFYFDILVATMISQLEFFCFFTVDVYLQLQVYTFCTVYSIAQTIRNSDLWNF